MQDFKTKTAVTHICKPHKPTHRPKLAKECACPTQEKVSKYFSNASKKYITLYTKALTMQTADTYRHDNWTREKEAHAHNKVLPKSGVTNFYDSFVINRTLVFQISSSAETPRLRQYPNR